MKADISPQMWTPSWMVIDPKEFLYETCRLKEQIIKLTLMDGCRESNTKNMFGGLIIWLTNRKRR